MVIQDRGTSARPYVLCCTVGASLVSANHCVLNTPGLLRGKRDLQRQRQRPLSLAGLNPSLDFIFSPTASYLMPLNSINPPLHDLIRVRTHNRRRNLCSYAHLTSYDALSWCAANTS